VREGSITKVSAAAALFLLAGGCSSGPPPLPVIGEAFVGPATLKIRSDLPLQSAPVATVRHGERLEILQRRRRFFRVRTRSGAIGWTDERQLLGSDDMAELRELARRASKLPVQGRATTFGDLNVHTQPSRQSPSFLQVKENEKVDVLEHVVTPRVDLPRKPLLPPAPKKAKAEMKKRPAKPSKYPPPPMPKPPPPPENWLELSKTDPEEPEVVDEEPEEKPTPTDEWSLVRTASGQSGWVLTRRLLMAIPDEVAQYAEGRRIVSYFSLGTVEDGGDKKNIWLWTTVGSGAPSYDFDSFRVFIWNLRKHRYETAYIERNLKGYAPVLQHEVDFGTGKTAAKYPGFSICMERKDGQRVRREYALLGNVIRSAGEQPCEAQPASVAAAKGSGLSLLPETAPAKESWWQRLRKRFRK
jgi:uncharacterized protein YgiM (DUF1202 family)